MSVLSNKKVKAFCSIHKRASNKSYTSLKKKKSVLQFRKREIEYVCLIWNYYDLKAEIKTSDYFTGQYYLWSGRVRLIC